MDVVDAFVVSLGLDPTEYNREIKKYREDRKRLADEEVSYSREQEDGQKRVEDGVRRLRNETAGFLLMLAGANSLQQFVGNMLSGDAATGRFAANIGMATERVSVWEEVVKRAGGTAQDAQAALGSLSSIFQSYQLTGDNSKAGDLAFFGLSERDLANPEAALMRIAEIAPTLPQAELSTRLGRLGIGPELTAQLAKGRPEIERLVRDIEKVGVATDESAQAAIEFNANMAKIEQTIKATARPAVEQLAETLSKLAENEDAVNAGLAIGIGVLGAMGIAATVAFAPIVLLAGAIAVVVANLDKLKAGWRDFNEWNEGLIDRFAPDEDWLEEFRGSEWGQALGARTSGQRQGELDWGMAGRDAMGNRTGGATSGGRNAATVERFFQSKGFSPAQARGIAASVVAEGGLGTRTGGGYKGRALGIGQWLGSRRAEFLKRYGNNFTLQNELDFFLEEMHGPDGKNVAGRIKQSGDSGLIARMMVDEFYRPAKGAETVGDYRRAAAYLKQPSLVGRAAGNVSQANTTTIGQVVVYTPSDNAEGIVRDIRGEMAKRGLVVQADTGMRP